LESETAKLNNQTDHKINRITMQMKKIMTYKYIPILKYINYLKCEEKFSLSTRPIYI